MRSELRRGEERLRRALLDDLAAVHEDHTVRDAPGEAHLVRHHHHGHALPGQIGHDLQHLVDHLGVERGGGLVEEHDPRLHGERARDGDALLLAAGEVGGIVPRLVGDADPRQERARGLLRLRRATARAPSWAPA